MNGKPVYYLVGENNKILDGAEIDAGYISLISCDNVTIRNFNLTQNGEGLWLVNTTNSKIENCNILKNTCGIHLQQSSNNTISNCDIFWNNWTDGIILCHSSYNVITNCNVYSNHWEGVYAYCSSNNIIKDCQISENYFAAVSFGQFSDDNTVTNCDLSNSSCEGVVLDDSSKNTIENCSVASNKYDAFWICDSSCNNLISNCTISNNNYGIRVHGTDANNNHIYHNNFINNNISAYDPATNFWDNGYPSGGNYWSDYTGSDLYSGVNQDEPGSDGVGDTPYNISGGTNQDRYPLMSPWGDANITQSSLTVTTDKSTYQPGEAVIMNIKYSSGVGGVLARETIPFSSEGWVWESIIFSSPPQLTAGTTYYIWVNLPLYYGWAIQTGPDYDDPDDDTYGYKTYIDSNLDQQYTGPFNGGSYGMWVSQSFTPSISGELNEVDLYLTSQAYTGGVIIVEIRDLSDQTSVHLQVFDPSNCLIYTQSVQTNSTGDVAHTFTLPNNITQGLCIIYANTTDAEANYTLEVFSSTITVTTDKPICYPGKNVTVKVKHASSTESWVNSSITYMDKLSTTLGDNYDIVVDKNGVFHICYVDYKDNNVKYKSSLNYFTTATIVNSTGRQPVIDVDSEGVVYIVYIDSSGAKLKSSADSFSNAVNIQTGSVDHAIAIDNNNVVHIVTFGPLPPDPDNSGLLYRNSTDNYATYTQITPVETSPDVWWYSARHPSIDVDSERIVHVAYAYSYNWQNTEIVDRIEYTSSADNFATRQAVRECNIFSENF